MTPHHFSNALSARPRRAARRGAARLFLGLALSAGCAAAPQAQPAEAQIAIAAQPLGDALIQLARQTSLQLLYAPETVRGLRAPAVAGRLAPEQALRQLLQGSGIEYTRQGNTITLSRPQAGTVAELDTVTVVGQGTAGPAPAYTGGQVATAGGLGLLGERDVMETPFNVTTYTSDLIRDQQAGSVADVLLNDPSVRATGGERGGESETFAIRGFMLDSTDLSFNGLPGIAPIYKSSTGYLERVEVLKGPSALLSGMTPNGSVGGSINLVPKRAEDEALTRVSASYAMRSQYGQALDIGRRFGEDNRYGIRVNASRQDGDTGVDHQQARANLGSVALDYRGSRLRWSGDLVSQYQRTDGATRGLTVADGVAMPDAPDARRNPGQPWEYSRTRNTVAATRAEYDFTDAITGFAAIGKSRGRFEALFGNPTILDDAGNISTTDMPAKFIWDTVSSQAGVRARFRTGGVDHALSLSGDSLVRKSGYAFSGCAGPVASNLYDPVVVDKPDCGPMPGNVPWNARTTLHSLALADTLSMWDRRVQLTAGVRRQDVKAENFSSGRTTSKYDEHAYTPMAGLVVRPWNQVSFYGNYIEGLSAGQIAQPPADNAGEVFPPFKSRQVEVGVKVDTGTLGATLAAFQIRQPSANLNDNVFSVNGEQRNRGLELNVYGEVARGVRLLGGAAYNDATLTQTPDGANEGNRAVNVPRWQTNLGAEWDLPWAPGLTLTSLMVYNGAQYRDQANTQRLPSWTRVDLGARYRTRVAERPVTFRLNVYNVFGRDYWTGSATTYGAVYLGAPRSAVLSASVDF